MRSVLFWRPRFAVLAKKVAKNATCVPPGKPSQPSSSIKQRKDQHQLHAGANRLDVEESGRVGTGPESDELAVEAAAEVGE